MTLQEIIDAVNNGQTVFWKSPAYQVVKDKNHQFLIQCQTNNNCIGLTWMDGVTLNGKEEDFYVAH